MKRAIIQDWVCDLELRHQGTLMTAVRGCDTVERDEPVKWLARFYRACVLNAHVGDVRKAKTFVVWTDNADDFWVYAGAVVRSHDHLPHHYIMHLIHAAEILGYKYPVEPQRAWWQRFYERMCAKMHMAPETETHLDERLNADEKTFDQNQEF
jgi:hypothetical protein